MSALTLDLEFMQCWQRLSVQEKESLLRMAKGYVQAKREDDPALLRSHQFPRTGDTYLSGEGKSYTWQDLKQLTDREIK